MNRRADGTDQRAIIGAITAMGTSLGMLTIAEGVETSEQLAGIRSVGCNSVQGYIFSKPVAKDAVNGIIADFATRHSQPQAA
jgi:EAL domain-containing protein (putative c-di-GMP-specific phosphodiesterase class I)